MTGRPSVRTVGETAAAIAAVRDRRAAGQPQTIEERLDFLEGAFAALVDSLADGTPAVASGPSLEDQHRGFVERIRTAEGDRFGGRRS
jgi:hypothetical protein